METVTYEEIDPFHWQYYVLLLVVYLIITCLLMNTIANLLQRISGDLHSINVGQVWITVIPFFGSIWLFYVIQQMANMLQEEFGRRKIVEFETSPGLGVGWGYAFLVLTAHLTLLVDIPIVTVLLYLASTLLLVLYWVKLSGFREKIERDSLSTFHQQPMQFEQPYYPPHEIPAPPPAQPLDEWNRWKPK